MTLTRMTHVIRKVPVVVNVTTLRLSVSVQFQLPQRMTASITAMVSVSQAYLLTEQFGRIIYDYLKLHISKSPLLVYTSIQNIMLSK